MKAEQLKYVNFWPKVSEFAKGDAEIRHTQDRIDQLTPAYEAIVELLPGEQREQLELYIGACEALFQHYAVAAYELGRTEGPRKPNETFRDWVDDPDTWEKLLARCDESEKARKELR